MQNEYVEYLLSEKKVPHPPEYRIVTPGNEIKWVQGISHVILDDNENIREVIGITQDITQRKISENLVKENENKLKTIIDQSPFPIAFADINDEKIIYWSQSSLELFGHNPKTVSEWYKLAYPDPAYREEVIKRWKPFLEKAQKTKKVVNTGEYQIVCKDGTIKTCEIYAQFIPDNLIVTLNDITDRKNNEILLEKKNIDLKLAQRIASVGTWTLDPEVGVPEWSDEIYRIYERDPKLGPYQLADCNTIYKGKYWERFNTSIHEAINYGSPYDIELKLGLPSGKIKWVHAICEPDAELGPNGHKLRGTIQDITYRKLAEIEIEANEKQFRNLFESNPMPTFLWKREDAKIFLKNINSAANKMTYGKAEQFIGLSADQIYHDRPDISSHLKNCFENKANITFETEYYSRGTGLNRHIIFTFVYISDESLMLYSEDISERKKFEERLRFQANLLDTIEQAAIVTDTEGHIIYWNPFAEKLYGWTVKEAIGKTTIDLIATEKSLKFGFEIMTSLQKGQMWSGEYLARNRAGAKFPVHTSCTPIFNNDGELTNIIGISYDITEQKQTEKALKVALDQEQQKNNEIKALLEASKAILQYQDFNESAKKIFYACSKAIQATAGYVALLSEDGMENEVLFLESGGRDCTVDPELPMPIRGLRGEAYRLGKAVWDNDFHHSQWMKYMPKGHSKLDNVMFVPLKINNKTIGIMGYANKNGGFNENDVELATAFGEFAAIALNNSMNIQKIRTAQTIAEIANKAKSEFLANMSHEIRTPINAMLGFSQILKDQYFGYLNTKQVTYIDNIIESNNRLLFLINDILDLSKIEAGKIEISLAPFRFDHFVERLNQTLLSLSNKKSITTQIKASPDIPNYLIGDEYRIEQILRNLISNAVKFTDKGYINVSIEKKFNSEILFKVSDTGIGIPKNQQEKLFDKFYQADSSKSKKYAGTGLGLAISKELINLMGGKIWFESEINKGSSFYFTLKLKDSDTPSSQEVDQNKPVATAIEGLRKSLNILLAEDDELNRESMSYFLKREGHQITYANNGKEVLTALEAENIDIILMDVQMPEMDGIEATIQIRGASSSSKFNPRVPSIALTANAMRGDREKFIEAGMNDYVSKPVDFDLLFEKISSLICSTVKITEHTEGNEPPESKPIKEIEDFISKTKDHADFAPNILKAFLKEAPIRKKTLDKGVFANS